MAEIATHVLGCKVNFADIQAIAGSLPLPERPVALVGTCCVTAEGEKQSRKEVRRAARRVGPQGRVYVAGCAARRNPEVFEDMGENIVVIASGAGEVAGGAPGLPVAGAELAKGRMRFFLKVQDGCATGCRYCVIPQVRGRPRSIPMNEVMSNAAAALAAGFPELVVTGINVGAYRDGASRLPQLLEGLSGLKGLKRLRLSSIEINHAIPELMDVFRRHPVIGRHLHLPLQSGDDGVLKSMGRRYQRADVSGCVKAVRTAVPDINITTDVIVGFPTEDETAFTHTLELMEETGFSKAHVFAYSRRSGTPAESLGDPVKPAEKKRRSRLVRELSERLQNAHRQRKVGSLNEILLESSQSCGIHGGYSSDYTRFSVKGGSPGSLVTVLARSVNGEAVWGELGPQ